MESKLQIFVSSTFLDLRQEREAAVEAILKSGNLPAGMELFTAGNKSQWEVIQRWISESDIYVVIIGGRYGSIEPNSGLSYTELEYDFAVSSGKPFFAIVIDDDALEAKVKEHGSKVMERENPAKLAAFKEKILSKMSSFFSDSKDVKLAILETVPQLAAEYELKGWIRADGVPDTRGLADELSRVHAENRTLHEKIAKQTKKIEKLQAAGPSAGADEEFTEIAKVLHRSTIEISALKSAIGEYEDEDVLDDIPDEANVLTVALTFRDNLMTGVTNRMGANEISSFLFFLLCPKLQVHGLVENEKVTGVRYRRYSVTKKGVAFFSYLDRVEHKKKDDAKDKRNKKAVAATTDA